MRDMRVDIRLFMSRDKNRSGQRQGGASAPPSSFRPALNPAMADDLESRVLYRDSHIIILDKPAGLAVHPGPSTLVSLEAYLPSLRFGITEPPVAAHRIDRDTSGCLVLARNARSRSRLGRLFEAGAVQKIYWGIVDGVPVAPMGEIKLALSKRSNAQGWRMEADPAGLRAETHYRILYEEKGRSLLELRLLTGRTHQIRAHCAALGHPIIGDPIYGHRTEGTAQLLHARHISIPYRVGSAAIDATAPTPDRFLLALDRAAFQISL